MTAEQPALHRLFTAVELPEDTRASLAALQGDFPGMRWVDPSRMHLTLRFIGEVDAACAEAVRQSLASVHAAPFVLRLKRLGSFYRRP
ncbi:MAG: RNA 2',3'-cyclic phosphodiesterase, partial [Desulfovibrio sp.]|nr:RNA 2',3'-cyclic phosphodiesterase [Desulfovibrio sp.]